MGAYRREKVGSAIRDIVGETIAHRLQDPRISSLTTVTRVEVSGDLLAAKIYLSFVGSEADERKCFRAIEHASGHIQRIVASKLHARQCPQLRFAIDESVKIARQTMAILEQNRRENPALVEADAPSDEEEQPEPQGQPDAEETDTPSEGMSE